MVGKCGNQNNEKPLFLTCVMTNVNATDYRHLLNKRYVIQKYTQGTAPPLIPHLACCTNFQTPQTAMVEENEEETTELEKCDCCTPFDPAKFVDVDNPSYLIISNTRGYSRGIQCVWVSE